MKQADYDLFDWINKPSYPEKKYRTNKRKDITKIASSSLTKYFSNSNDIKKSIIELTELELIDLYIAQSRLQIAIDQDPIIVVSTASPVLTILIFTINYFTNIFSPNLILTYIIMITLSLCFSVRYSANNSPNLKKLKYYINIAIELKGSTNS